MSDDGSEGCSAGGQGDESSSEAPPEPGSSVVSLTADFSMQNVILQVPTDNHLQLAV